MKLQDTLFYQLLAVESMNDEIQDKAFSAGSADTAGTAGTIEPFRATEQANGTAEEETLEQTGEDVPSFSDQSGISPIVGGVYAVNIDANKISTKHAGQVGVNGQTRNHQ